MQKRTIVSLVAASLFLTTSTALACTTVLVGKDQTVDGSYLVGRTVDAGVKDVCRMVLHPRRENKTGKYISSCDKFTYPIPKKSLAYSSVPHLEDSNLWGEVGFNEAGVGMSATETIIPSAAVLAVDPFVKDTGAAESTIFNCVLPSVHTAREGAALLGKIVEEAGTSEGFGVAFVDTTGIWYLESAGGHRYLAVKVPDNKYFVTGNQGRLRDYDPQDRANYMGSKDLISFAEKHNLYNPQEGAFNFNKAYMNDTDKDHTYSYPRVWAMQHLLTPGITTKVEDGAKCPVFLAAEKKLSVNDVKEVFRNHYTGTEHDPYLHSNPQEPYRPISVFRCLNAHIQQVRPELPLAIGRVTYIAFGMPSLGLYIPYYQGLESYLPAYTKGSQEASDDSAFWKYRKVQTLAMSNYNSYAPIVQKAYADFEAATAVKQAKMEKGYLELYRSKPAQAQKLLQNFENEVMQGGLDVADRVANKIITQMTYDVGNKYLFHRE
ncbi:MAG: C69 family dipeptidase [Acidaminococcaceae bacterium]|jgi:dipeptidase|nr:C69 family dipeptidase [Acidaminococcaceae bacterium]